MELIRVKKEVDANDFNEDEIDIEEHEVAFGKCKDIGNEAFRYRKSGTSKFPVDNEEKCAFQLNTEKGHLKISPKLSTDETCDKEQIKIENSIDLSDGDIKTEVVGESDYEFLSLSQVFDRGSDKGVNFTKTKDSRYRKNVTSKSPDDNEEKYTFQLNTEKDYHKISQKLSRNVTCEKEHTKIENSIDFSHEDIKTEVEESDREFFPVSEVLYRRSNNDVDFTKTKEPQFINKEHTKFVANSTDIQDSTSSLRLKSRDVAVSKQKCIVEKNTLAASEENILPYIKDDKEKQVCTPIDRGHLKRNCRSIYAVENRFSRQNLIILLEKIDAKKWFHYKISKSSNPNKTLSAHDERNDDKSPRCKIHSKLFNGRSKQCIRGKKSHSRICPKAFNCERCMKIYNSSSFDCKFCAKSFLSKSGLKIHEELHRREYKCKICSKTFPSADVLRNHEIIHTGEKPYQCQVCFIYFTSTSNLRKHEMNHTREKPLHCKICSKSFALKSNLRIHEEIHMGKKYRCNICSKSFGRSDYLKNHLVVHTGEKPYRCKICSKSFPHRGSLKGHERIHTGEKPYRCKICFKSFCHRGSLKGHERIHTGERPYHCNFCTYNFKHRSHLTIHERIHTGERPFKCKSCGKAFYKAGHLRGHERTHEKKSQEKLFHCKFCRKGFTQERWLRSHEKIHE